MKTMHFQGFGDVPITLNNDDVHGVFTQGYCGALATALNHMTGCKMIMSQGHAAVISFDGLVLDIEGVHDPDKFEKEWGETEPCDEHKLDRDRNFHSTKHWKKALPFAKLLVKKYLH